MSFISNNLFKNNKNRISQFINIDHSKTLVYGKGALMDLGGCFALVYRSCGSSNMFEFA